MFEQMCVIDFQYFVFCIEKNKHCTNAMKGNDPNRAYGYSVTSPTFAYDTSTTNSALITTAEPPLVCMIVGQRHITLGFVISQTIWLTFMHLAVDPLL
jgi:hypothetical protein